MFSVGNRVNIRKHTASAWLVLAVLASAVFTLYSAESIAALCVLDDQKKELCLEQPAKRIVALSPGATELLFSAGAGDRVVAVTAHSDYPPQALELPSVGNHQRFDQEALLALEPDLVITWVSGNPASQVGRLQKLGLPLFAIEPRTFEGIADTLERLSTLAGTEPEGFAEAERFRAGIIRLTEEYRYASPVPVFYQVWEQPLMTINNEHLIGKVIQLCGARNIFGDMPRLVPRISKETVLQANPDVIVTASVEGISNDQLDHWKNYSGLNAVEKNNLLFVPASLISRPTPRLLEAAERMCEKLEIAREHL